LSNPRRKHAAYRHLAPNPEYETGDPLKAPLISPFDYTGHPAQLPRLSPPQVVSKVLEREEAEGFNHLTLRTTFATNIQDVHSSIIRLEDDIQTMDNVGVKVGEDHDLLPGLTAASVIETLEIVSEMGKEEGQKREEKQQGKQRFITPPHAQEGSPSSPVQPIPPFASSSRLSTHFDPSTTSVSSSASWSLRQTISVGTQSEPLVSIPLHTCTAVPLANSKNDIRADNELDSEFNFGCEDWGEDYGGREDYGGGEELAMGLDDANHGDENGFDVECSIEGTKFGGEAEECGEEDEHIEGEKLGEDEIEDPVAKGPSTRREDEQEDNLEE
jgi:hypothetical protein